MGKFLSIPIWIIFMDWEITYLHGQNIYRALANNFKLQQTFQLTVCTSGSGVGWGGVQGVRPPLKNTVKGFNPKYKIIS